MNLQPFLDGEFLEHEPVLQATREWLAELTMMFCGVAEKALNGGNKILFMKDCGSEMVGLANPFLIIRPDRTHRIQKMQTVLGQMLKQRCVK